MNKQKTDKLNVTIQVLLKNKLVTAKHWKKVKSEAKCLKHLHASLFLKIFFKKKQDSTD